MYSVIFRNCATGKMHRLLQRPIGLDASLNSINEDVEKELRITRARCALRMKLYTEVWAAGVSDTLIAVVVGVDKELLPAFWQRFCVNFEAVVLGCYVASSRQATGA